MKQKFKVGTKVVYTLLNEESELKEYEGTIKAYSEKGFFSRGYSKKRYKIKCVDGGIDYCSTYRIKKLTRSK